MAPKGKAAEKPKKKTQKSPRFLSVEETEQFIDAVQCYPCLYDCSIKDYKDQTVQARARAAIAEQFDEYGPDDVFAKWKSLREKYTRERKIVNGNKPPSGSARMKNRPKWAFYDQMSFLDAHVKQRLRMDNLLDAGDVDDEEEDDNVRDKPENIVEMRVEDVPFVPDGSDERNTIVVVTDDWSDTHGLNEDEQQENVKHAESDQDSEIEKGSPNSSDNRSSSDEEQNNEQPPAKKKKVSRGHQSNNAEQSQPGEKHDQQVKIVMSTVVQHHYKKYLQIDHRLFENFTDPPGFKNPIAKPRLEERQSAKQKASANKKMEQEGLPVELVSEMAGSFKTLTSLMVKKMENKPNEVEKTEADPESKILKDCETFCLAFARKMATIPTELSRDMMQMEMHSMFIKYKHKNSADDGF